MAVSIVTDSTADIEPGRAAALGVTVVPLFVLWGNRSYRDYIDLSRAEFYRMLVAQAQLPTTSQPTAAMFEEAFRPAVERGDTVLCIVISSHLSGTINAARSAAAAFPDARINVVDSESVSGGLRMQVLGAHERLTAGASLETVLADLEREKQTQRLFACIPDLSHLQRTGRIGKAQAALGTMMKIVPVLHLEAGSIGAQAQVRTFARAQETMIDLTMASVTDPANARFLVIHTNAPELGESVRKRLAERFQGVTPKVLDVVETGPVIAVHGGPGAVGIFSAQD